MGCLGFAVLEGGLGVFVLGQCGRVGAGGKACRKPFFNGPFGEPNFESRTVSPNCRGTYFVTPFLGRNPAPFWGRLSARGRSKRRHRCIEALRTRCWSLCGGIGRGCVCASMGGRGAAGRIAEQVVERETVAR